LRGERTLPLPRGLEPELRPELVAVVERVVAEFAGLWPRQVVEAEVAAADRELRGQVPAGAMDELLYRLVAARLDP
jgi:hypothetical protein